VLHMQSNVTEYGPAGAVSISDVNLVYSKSDAAGLNSSNAQLFCADKSQKQEVMLDGVRHANRPLCPFGPEERFTSWYMHHFRHPNPV
jgi:hypothetical protein